jgi:hypothetical protein
MSEEVDFKSLNLPIPESTKLYSIEQQREMFQYLSEMNDNEKKGYEIAVNHLESSFNIYRSNGFIEWKKSKQ